MQKILVYTKTWEKRCYKDGIPDEVPKKLFVAKRAPSYKAIALAILSNDHNLHSLGFSQKESHLTGLLYEESAKRKNKKKHEKKLKRWLSEKGR